MSDDDWGLPFVSADMCPLGPHRGPMGPNEDLSTCPMCWSMSWVLRPDGEEYGRHLPDCALPRRHPGLCVGGGTGHPPAPIQRGYFPEAGDA